MPWTGDVCGVWRYAGESTGVTPARFSAALDLWSAPSQLAYGFTQIREPTVLFTVLGSATVSPRSSAVAKVQPETVG